MFQRLQKERESEERKLEASKATLKEQQQQLEKEVTDQKSKLDQVLTKLLGTEERVRTLQEEERWGEALEKTLSQTSMYSGTSHSGGGVLFWCFVKYVQETQGPHIAQKGGRSSTARSTVQTRSS